MEETSFIGEPVFGDNANRRSNGANANWKIGEEGSHIYRILPPCGMLAKIGRWSFYEALHWGYTLSNGKKRPFRCIQRKNRKTGMVEVECPQCTLIAEKQATFDARKKELEAKGKNPNEVKELMKPLDMWLRNFNLEKVHFLNVMRQDNQIGRLKVKIKQKQALDLVLKALMEKKGINPVSIKEGVWIDFQRVGMGRHDTTYPVEIVKEEVDIGNGVKAETIKKAPLSTEVLKRMEKEAFELATYYKDLTYDQIKMLVSSGGDPEITDSLFGAPVVTPMATTAPDVEEYEDDVEAAEEMVTQAPTETQEDAAEAALLAQLAAMRAKKSTPSTPAVSEVKTESSKPASNLSTEEFIATFQSSKQ